MNILFVSTLSGRNSVGPSWSVPARIKAQEKYDNILWVNISNAEMPHWKEIASFHHLSEFGDLRLKNFPKPFDKPDVVVCENFYSMEEVRLARELRKYHIPYVVVPRGSLSFVARNNKKKWKKAIAHILWFDKYVRKASAVQFLTEVERDSSIPKDIKSFVLPNGFNTPQEYKESFSEKQIRCVFIGRIDIYQKGLDLLLNAIRLKKDILANDNVSFSIYGPKSPDTEEMYKRIQELGLTELVSLKGETSGDAKKKVLLTSDVFILTSRSEGHPMGLIEALAYGLPCLVSKGSNMTKEIKDTDSGWTCLGDNEESIGEALEAMVKDKKSFLTKSLNARTLAKNYDWDVLAKKFHEKLEELI